MSRAAGALPIILLWVLPLLLALPMLLPAAVDAEAWQLLFAHPQLWPGLALSLATGAVSTLLALVLALIILAGLPRHRLQAWAAPGLALPHLAFAIGFGFLLMPSGLLARLFVGGDAPPQWVSVQDPWGITLTLALALKELPFLLTAAVAALSRGDAAARLPGELAAAASLGHAPGSAFLRITMPPLLRALRWPLVIVFVYGATVVDMALVLGPTQPPTLAVVIWRALNDVQPAVNAMGIAGTLLLTATLATMLLAAALLRRVMASGSRSFLTAGPSPRAAPRRMAAVIGMVTLLLLGLAFALLVMLSLAPRWPYPALLPPAVSLAPWQSLAATPAPLGLSLVLGFTVTAAAVALAMLWFETQHPQRDRWMLGLALLALVLPQLASGGGQYRLFLSLGLTGTLPGLFLAHLTSALAYVLIVLEGPWRGYDQRFTATARALSATPLRAFLKVKLPLLKAPVLGAAAIAFAVAIAQFVPAQLIAAGRYSTLPMEAVTLASGGNRPLTAAYALALAVPPLLAFLAASLLGRPRWR